MKGWELTDELNKVAVRFFRGATTSQVRWHVKPTIEKIEKVSLYIAVLMM